MKSIKYLIRRTLLSILLLLISLKFFSCGTETPVTNTNPPQALFQKHYGGSGDDYAYALALTSDGGFIAAGSTTSFGAVIPDIYIIRLTSDGKIVWSRTYGGTIIEAANSIVQTSDGGFIVAGVTNSFGAGQNDMYILRLTSEGNSVWAKTYGGMTQDAGVSIVQTSDGGFIAAGTTNSFGAGNYDMYVVRLSSDGGVMWSKAYGGTNVDGAASIIQTSDGGFIAAGSTYSFGAGVSDMYAVRIASDGSLIWSKTYGGATDDGALSIKQNSDGGFITAGYTNSFGAGDYDVFVVRLSSDGSIVWGKTYGGPQFDATNNITRTSDGGFALAGRSSSFGTGNGDMYLLRLTSDGSVSWSKTLGGSNVDVAFSIVQASNGGFAAGGYTNSYGTGYDMYVVRLGSDGSVCGNSTNPSTIVSLPTVLTSTPTTVTTTASTVTNTAPPTIFILSQTDSVICKSQ